ncbi:MAG: glycosyltransferase [Chromatiales bacterium]|nr:glycosyltransferase [Chromatiales bacterium]
MPGASCSGCGACDAHPVRRARLSSGSHWRHGDLRQRPRPAPSGAAATTSPCSPAKPVTDQPEYRVHRDRAGEVAVVRVNHTFRDATSFEHTYRNATIDAIAGALLDEERPDVVHVHHLTCLSTGIAAECAARGIPFVLTLNDYWLLCHRGQLLDLRSRALRRARGRRAARRAPDCRPPDSPPCICAARGLRAIERRAPKALADAQRRLVSGASRRVVPRFGRRRDRPPPRARARASATAPRASSRRRGRCWISSSASASRRRACSLQEQGIDVAAVSPG